jgi:hypothetical protein
MLCAKNSATVRSDKEQGEPKRGENETPNDKQLMQH